MPKLSYVFLGFFLLAALGCTNEPPKIGVVNVVRVVNESMEGQKANAVVNALVKAKQADLKKQEATLEELKKGLGKEPSKAKKDEFNKAAVAYQKEVNAADEEVKKKAAELRKVVVEHIKKAIDTIGQDEKFLMIFTNENIAFFQQSTDLTGKVIKKYNELQGSK